MRADPTQHWSWNFDWKWTASSASPLKGPRSPMFDVSTTFSNEEEGISHTASQGISVLKLTSVVRGRVTLAFQVHSNRWQPVLFSLSVSNDQVAPAFSTDSSTSIPL